MSYKDDLYCIYDNEDDFPVGTELTWTEAAAAMGLTPGSFRSLLARQRQGSRPSARWTIMVRERGGEYQVPGPPLPTYRYDVVERRTGKVMAHGLTKKRTLEFLGMANLPKAEAAHKLGLISVRDGRSHAPVIVRRYKLEEDK